MKIRKFDNFDQVNEGSQGGGNKFILVRFGTAPSAQVSRYFAEVALKNPKPILMKSPNAFVTMFDTSATKEALIQGFDRLGISYNLYQIVHTSGGGTGPALVGRQRTPAMVKKELEKAIKDEDYGKAAQLRDELAQLEGRPSPVGGHNESHTFSFEDFKLIEKEEEFVNGTNTEEFNKLVSQLVDHELEEFEEEEGKEEKGITKDDCQKIKDYLVQNNFYVAPEKKEKGDKKEGEE